MATQAQGIARPGGMQQQQQHQQQFESGQPGFTMEQLRQQQMAQQKAQIQQRMAAEQVVGPGTGGPQGPPGTIQMPPSYLQNQIMRQRQAAANAAANWAAQQERGPVATQRLGSAILRLLNFSEQLNSFAEPGNLEAWKRFVDEFYVDPALCTQSLPSDPELSYELPTPLLPAYFHQMHREVVKLNLTFHDAREYYLPPQNHIVECPKCTMCYYFKNFTKIEVLGKLRIVFAPGPPPNFPLKMESWEFIGEEWDEWICRMPPPPIKAGGDSSRNSMDRDTTMKDANGSAAPEGGNSSQQGSTGENDDENEDDGNNDDDNDDHEDLFGRSPTASNQDPTSRRSSKSEKVKNKRVAEETSPKHTDPNKRARMVMQNGVTARHLRFLEISDVLGQLSPLFGRKSPKETLATLLQSLPKLPTLEKDDDLSSQSKDVKSSHIKENAPPAKQGDHRKAQNNLQKTQQIQSGRAMQQQAAQVLQKQAAQTLSQALPPDDLEFPETAETMEESHELAENGHEDDDLFASNASSDPLDSHHHVKMEEIDPENDEDAIDAELENEFGISHDSGEEDEDGDDGDDRQDVNN